MHDARHAVGFVNMLPGTIAYVRFWSTQLKRGQRTHYPELFKHLLARLFIPVFIENFD